MRDEGRAGVQARVQELTIARVGAAGDGVAEGGGYVPGALPGERVLARMSGERGALLEVLEPSPERVAPPCPHFGACGGCALQHWAPAPYLAWKAEQIRLALSHAGLRTDIATPIAAPPHARRRLALHARKRGGAIELGFKARRSWELVPIKVCPISRPELVEALPGLAALAAPLFACPKSAPTLHVTSTLTGLDVDITGVEARRTGLSGDARVRIAEIAGAQGLARVSLAGEVLFQSRPPEVRFGRATVALPPGSFLQAVASAEQAMAAAAVEAVRGAAKVADLFCGAGAFTFRLAEVASVIAADASEPAVAALRRAIGTAPGLKPIAAEARDLFRRPLSAAELKGVDAVVFDPPRAGAFDQARAIAGSKAGVVVGVSCNAATFARDAAVLVERGGFRLERVLPVDQFLWSPHIELVGAFRR